MLEIFSALSMCGAGLQYLGVQVDKNGDLEFAKRLVYSGFIIGILAISANTIFIMSLIR